MLSNVNVYPIPRAIKFYDEEGYDAIPIRTITHIYFDTLGSEHEDNQDLDPFCIEITLDTQKTNVVPTTLINSKGHVNILPYEIWESLGKSCVLPIQLFDHEGESYSYITYLVPKLRAICLHHQ